MKPTYKKLETYYYAFLKIAPKKGGPVGPYLRNRKS